VLHIHDLHSGAAKENVTEEVIYSFNDLREARTDKYQSQRSFWFVPIPSYKLHASSQLYDKLRSKFGFDEI
jgi:hypothetical protein